MGFDDGRMPLPRGNRPPPRATPPDPDGSKPGGSTTISSRPPEAETEPTILLVGAEQSFHTAIASALAQHGVYVETSPINGVVDSVVATAPDLVVLVGEAASDAGSDVLASLNASLHTSVVPVAILADDAALAERLRAFRHGAAAVISRSASVDAMAEQMAKLAREIPDREREALGTVGEATLSELVEALSKELRTGILSVRSTSGAEDDAVRVVLGGGRPLAQTIDEFVSRIRRHVVHAEPLQYEFDERAGGTVQLLGAQAIDGPAGNDDVEGLRILLADQNAARADSLAQALREHAASVVVTDFQPTEQRFTRLRQLDPAILMIDEASLHGEGFELVRRMRRDARLRWTSLLVIRWEDIWSEAEESPTVERMLGTLATLAEPEQALQKRVGVGHPFDTRLEITGPARLLRALTACPNAVRVTVYNSRVHARVDISDHLLTGVRAQLVEGGQPMEGALALSALLVLSSGRVHVERIQEAALVNIMATVDVALNLADSETPPIQPSIPVAGGPDDNERSLGFGSLSPRRSNVPRWVWALAAAAGILVIASLFVLLIPAGRRAAPAATPDPVAPTQPLGAASLAATSAAVAAPAEAPSAVDEGAEPEVAESTATLALELESHTDIPSCDKLVGPSWSLLTGDQPKRAAAEIHAGRRALIVGNLDEAQTAFCRATVLDANSLDAVSSLGRLYLLRRDAKEAKQWAERAAKQFPKDAEARNLYGDTLARVGETEQALAVWLDVVKVSPGDLARVRSVAATYAAGGERALRGADYAQADRLFRRAALLEPSSARAASGMARALLVQGEPRAAAVWARRAAALEPRDPDVHVTLGDALDKLAKTEEAYAAWKLAYELDPENRRAAARWQRIPEAQR